MKATILACCLLLAIAASPVKEFVMVRVDQQPVKAGDTVTLKTSAVFKEQACDFAPANASFYAKGAVIIDRTDWVRVDSFSFNRKITVRIGEVEQAIITAVLIKHEDKIISQVEIPVGN